MGLADTGTILVITGINIPYYAARGLHQTLTPIKESVEQDRDINGELIDLSNPIFRKYASKITCTDGRTPSFDGIWPGDVVTVYCACELSYFSGSPQRPEVSGSSYVSNGTTFYRPVLDMMVMNISNSLDEWSAEQQWSIELEEV